MTTPRLLDIGATEVGRYFAIIEHAAEGVKKMGVDIPEDDMCRLILAYSLIPNFINRAVDREVARRSDQIEQLKLLYGDEVEEA
jgi:hypothetical protein